MCLCQKIASMSVLKICVCLLFLPDWFAASSRTWVKTTSATEGSLSTSSPMKVSCVCQLSFLYYLFSVQCMYLRFKTCQQSLSQQKFLSQEKFLFPYNFVYIFICWTSASSVVLSPLQTIVQDLWQPPRCCSSPCVNFCTNMLNVIPVFHNIDKSELAGAAFNGIVGKGSKVMSAAWWHMLPLTNYPIGIPWRSLLAKHIPTGRAHVLPLLAHLHCAASSSFGLAEQYAGNESVMISLLVPVSLWFNCGGVIMCKLHAVMPRGHCERHTGVSWAQADIDDASSNRALREDASEDPEFGSWSNASSCLGMLQHMVSQRQCLLHCHVIAKLLTETLKLYCRPIKVHYVILCNYCFFTPNSPSVTVIVVEFPWVDESVLQCGSNGLISALVHTTVTVTTGYSSIFYLYTESSGGVSGP
jgi:hypothetical protein